MTDNGPYSLGGFRGKSSRRKAKWNQKGASRPSKGGNKSSGSAHGSIKVLAYSVVGVPFFVATVVIGLLVYWKVVSS